MVPDHRQMTDVCEYPSYEKIDQKGKNASLLFPDHICFVVAEYIGFHNHYMIPIFQTELPLSKQQLQIFSPIHANLAIESIFFLKPLLSTRRRRKGNSSFYKHGYLSRDDPLDLKEDFSEESLRNSSYSVLGDLSASRLVTKMLYWSLMYQNKKLHESLWTLSKIDQSLTNLNSGSYWLARFVACLRLQDMESFIKYHAVFLKEIQSPEKEEILLGFMEFQSFDDLKETRFISDLYWNEVLPISKEAILYAFYSDQKQMFHFLVTNWKERHQHIDFIQSLYAVEEQNENQLQIQNYFTPPRRKNSRELANERYPINPPNPFFE